MQRDVEPDPLLFLGDAQPDQTVGQEDQRQRDHKRDQRASADAGELNHELIAPGQTRAES